MEDNHAYWSVSCKNETLILGKTGNIVLYSQRNFLSFFFKYFLCKKHNRTICPPGLVGSQPLIILRSPLARGSFSGCSQPNVATCQRADIDQQLLKTGDSLELPGLNLTLQLARRQANSAVFQSDNAEATFAWRGEHVAGHLQSQGASWMLEGCGAGCFLWIQQTADWMDEASGHRDTKMSLESSQEPSQEWLSLRVGLMER